MTNKITVGSTMVVKKDIQTVDGMLYSGSRVEVEDAKSEKEIRVKDSMGKIYYLRVDDLREYKI